MNKHERKRLARSGKPLVNLHVLGAAGGVTGSLNFFEYFQGEDVVRFLVDVGLTVEDERVDFQNRLPAGITAADIDFVIISHAHIDHSGYLPKLVKDGFRGPAYMTEPTRDLLEILLPDSGFLQEESARHANSRLRRKNASLEQERAAASTQQQPDGRSGRQKNPRHGKRRIRNKPERQPLYTEKDARASLAHLRVIHYGERKELAPGVAVTFSEAGHILGSAVVNLEIGTGAYKRTFCFTGNIGRPDVPLLRELEAVKAADYLMTESTYGNAVHHRRDRLEELAGIINRAYERAMKPDRKYGYGVILIPAFAVGRAQVVLNDLRQLMEEKRIPTVPLFVDSPMTIRSTQVHRKHSELFNEETRRLVKQGTDLFRTPNHSECMDRAQSMLLDEPQKEPIIIVGSSGMASGGRIVQHLKARLAGKQNTVVFVGYQGTGTLGQALVGKRVGEKAPEAAKVVRIFGQPIPVNATIEFMPDYSAHADSTDMLKWMGKFERRPKQTFLVHGEPESLSGFKKLIESRLSWNVVIPKPREKFTL